MIMNNKQPKNDSCIFIRNCFQQQTDQIYLRLLAWIPALFCRRRDLLVLSKPAVESTEMSDSVSRLILLIGAKTRFLPRESGTVCRTHRNHEFPRPENRPHNGISCILLHRPFRTPFYIPAIKYETPSSHRSRHRLPLRLHRRIPPALRPGRAGRFTDVLIDCFGCAVVTLICTIKKSSSQR